jgi:hypothetical protein
MTTIKSVGVFNMKTLIALFFMFVFLAISACAIVNPIPRKTVFFTNGLVADDFSCLDKNYKFLELSCHRLIKGKNIVIGVRDFSSSSDHHSDSFKKLTIVLPEKIEAGNKYDIDNEINAYFSYGLTYGLAKVGCFGPATSGTIYILSVDTNKIVLKLDLVFNMKSPLGWKDRCKIEKYSESLTANFKAFELLTPWDGLSDEKSMGIDEAHPPR